MYQSRKIATKPERTPTVVLPRRMSSQAISTPANIGAHNTIVSVFHTAVVTMLNSLGRPNGTPPPGAGLVKSGAPRDFMRPCGVGKKGGGRGGGMRGWAAASIR